MDQSQLIEYISRWNNISVAEAEKLLGSAIGILKDKLLSGEDAEIPGLGILEVKSMPGRRTVFLKYLPDQTEGEEAPVSIYKIAVKLLSQGEIVSLPSIGTFQPGINEAGICTRVSFILSPVLRIALNKQQDAEPEENQEVVPGNIPEKEMIDCVETKETAHLIRTPDIENSKKEVFGITTNRGSRDGDKAGSIRIKTTDKEFKSTEKKGVKAEELQVSQEKGSKKKMLLLLGLCIFLFLIFFVIWTKLQPDPVHESISPVYNENLSGDLLELARKHYGHTAYWVYLYDANQEKLSSPFGSVRESRLIFPDLKTTYNVDTNDSLEIVRANMIADEILKKNR